MTWIKHRTDHIDIISKHFHLLSRTCTGTVPAICSINIDRDRSRYFTASIGKKGHDCTFFIHPFFLRRIACLIEVISIGGKPDIIELNLIKASPDQFLCNRCVVLPYCFIIWVNPVFFDRFLSVISCFVALPRLTAGIFDCITVLLVAV